MLKKGIVITSFNRPESLKKCLKSIFKSNLQGDYVLIIVQQDYNEKIQNVLNEFDLKKIKILKTSYPENWNVYKKMTLNGYKGFEYCFDKLKCDIGFYIEDDIIVSFDFFVFCEKILSKYKNDKNFFAVNGFSKEPFDINKVIYYSKFVFGIGKGWGINSDKWYKIKNLWNEKFIDSEHPEYDYPIENYIKKNLFYVVMPFCSRTYEIQGDGVSIKKNEINYFSDLKRSFTHIENKDYNYKYNFFYKYNWRKDCKKYKGNLVSLFYKIILNMKKYFKNS